ncbi:SH2B adaptor protein 1 SH2B1 transcript variant X6 mRNA [Crotalus adamanteus]|uniref:SH2B adaptor protein 1 SH2B1 transcript variant X6 mRNA n=1 Tax=Crotalus adamanteus TaxID=8729 RepID=A0AAW1B0D5_CROAD
MKEGEGGGREERNRKRETGKKGRKRKGRKRKGEERERGRVGERKEKGKKGKREKEERKERGKREKKKREKEMKERERGREERNRKGEREERGRKEKGRGKRKRERKGRKKRKREMKERGRERGRERKEIERGRKRKERERERGREERKERGKKEKGRKRGKERGEKGRKERKGEREEGKRKEREGEERREITIRGIAKGGEFRMCRYPSNRSKTLTIKELPCSLCVPRAVVNLRHGPPCRDHLLSMVKLVVFNPSAFSSSDLMTEVKMGKQLTPTTKTKNLNPEAEMVQESQGEREGTDKPFLLEGTQGRDGALCKNDFKQGKYYSKNYTAHVLELGGKEAPSLALHSPAALSPARGEVVRRSSGRCCCGGRSQRRRVPMGPRISWRASWSPSEACGSVAGCESPAFGSIATQMPSPSPNLPPGPSPLPERSPHRADTGGEEAISWVLRRRKLTVGPRDRVRCLDGHSGLSCFVCFRCNRLGHRAAECPVLVSPGSPVPASKLGPTPKKTPERSRVARQAEGVTPQQSPIEELPAATEERLTEYGHIDPTDDPTTTSPSPNLPPGLSMLPERSPRGANTGGKEAVSWVLRCRKPTVGLHDQ